jgi:hypothetical protein
VTVNKEVKEMEEECNVKMFEGRGKTNQRLCQKEKKKKEKKKNIAKEEKKTGKKKSGRFYFSDTNSMQQMQRCSFHTVKPDKEIEG